MRSGLKWRKVLSNGLKKKKKKSGWNWSFCLNIFQHSQGEIAMLLMIHYNTIFMLCYFKQKTSLSNQTYYHCRTWITINSNAAKLGLTS